MRARQFEKRTPELRLKLEGWRSRFVLVLVIAGFLVLAGRAFYLQALDTGFLQAKGEQRYTRVIDLPASRGKVLDRNGQLLAISTAVESIWAAACHRSTPVPIGRTSRCARSARRRFTGVGSTFSTHSSPEIASSPGS